MHSLLAMLFTKASALQLLERGLPAKAVVRVWRWSLTVPASSRASLAPTGLNTKLSPTVWNVVAATTQDPQGE